MKEKKFKKSHSYCELLLKVVSCNIDVLRPERSMMSIIIITVYILSLRVTALYGLCSFFIHVNGFRTSQLINACMHMVLLSTLDYLHKILCSSLKSFSSALTVGQIIMPNHFQSSLFFFLLAFCWVFLTRN